MSISLWEESFQEAQVDREKIQIKNLSVLGSKSKNGYEYSDRALDSTVRLLNGVAAYNKHNKTGTSRDVKTDLLGNFVNARRDGKKVRADLQLLEKEKWLLEVAEKMPRVTGFSIDADGELSRDRKIVEDVTKINSADLVDKPATNVGLFEEEEQKKMDLKELEERMKSQEEKIKLFEEEKKVWESEKAKLQEEKKAVELEKKRIDLREQCEKELPKGAITPAFLKILEECNDVKAAIEDRKAMLLEAQKSISFSRDNTMPIGTKVPTDEEVKSAFRKD